jgi:uncharacterized protein (TIGR00251 family)
VQRDASESGWWRRDDDGLVVAVRVVPGARRSEVVEASGVQLRVRIAAPAVDDKANVELQRFVADLFGVRRSAVTIVRGHRSRDKVLHVTGASAPPPSPAPPFFRTGREMGTADSHPPWRSPGHGRSGE